MYPVLGAKLIVSVSKVLNGSLKVAHIFDGLPCPTGHQVFKPAANFTGSPTNRCCWHVLHEIFASETCGTRAGLMGASAVAVTCLICTQGTADIPLPCCPVQPSACSSDQGVNSSAAAAAAISAGPTWQAADMENTEVT